MLAIRKMVYGSGNLMEALSFYRVIKERIEYGAILKEWISPEGKQNIHLRRHSVQASAPAQVVRAGEVAMCIPSYIQYSSRSSQPAAPHPLVLTPLLSVSYCTARCCFLVASAIPSLHIAARLRNRFAALPPDASVQ
jgi:hypothetical protein